MHFHSQECIHIDLSCCNSDTDDKIEQIYGDICLLTCSSEERIIEIRENRTREGQLSFPYIYVIID